jgi:hypothetical protein
MDGFKNTTKMKYFKTGGSVQDMCYGGKAMKKGGHAEAKEMGNDLAQDKKLIKKAFKQHDEAEHDKEPTEIKLRKGGRAKKDYGTVRKYKAGGSVTNVYQAKKKSGDIDAIEAVKDIKPGKAAAPSRATTKQKFTGSDVEKEKSKPSGHEDPYIKSKQSGKKAVAPSGAGGPDAFRKGGAIKKCAEGGQPGATAAQQKYYDKNKADAKVKEDKAMYEAMGSRGDAARKGMSESRMDQMGTAYKKGGKAKKLKKYADGGTVMSDEEKAYLGGADATDPFILARMRSALGDKKPVAAPVKAETSADLDPYGVTRRETSADLDPYNAASKSAVIAKPVALPPGPSADDRLRQRNARPVQAPNVEQDSGVAYPQGKPASGMYANRQPSIMQRFFSATPAEQATSFNKGVQARKNFGKNVSMPSLSMDDKLNALGKK